MKAASLVPVLVLSLAPLLTSSELILPLDCSDIYNSNHRQLSGIYTIYPIGPTSAVQVYCDMGTLGGRWTVFQRRLDGSVNFYRPWDHYKTGFGSAATEFWLGLENIFNLCLRKKYELLVNMADFEGNSTYAYYSSFFVGPEADGYRLQVTGFTEGDAGDALSVHNGHMFSTFNKDQDGSLVNCARLYMGAFWYGDCHSANPNGVYSWGGEGSIHGVGVEWVPWKGNNYSLKSITMKMRPVQ